MIAIHQRIKMFPTTMTLLANLLKIHFLEYCQTNISLTGSQFSSSWVCLFSLFLPSTNKSLFEKCNFLLSLMTNNSSMNRIPISNSTYVQISCAKYIPLLCQIWPQLLQKSSLFYQQSLGMIQTCVPNSQFSLILRIHLMTRSELQFTNYIHCSSKLSVSFHNSQLTTVLSLSVSAQRLSFRFFSWGSTLE